MSELILLGVIVVLAGLLGWRERENKLERSKLINAVLAKNAQELKELDTADKTPPPASVPIPDPLQETVDMPDDEFDKYIQEQLKNG